MPTSVGSSSNQDGDFTVHFTRHVVASSSDKANKGLGAPWAFLRFEQEDIPKEMLERATLRGQFETEQGIRLVTRGVRSTISYHAVLRLEVSHWCRGT